MENTCKAIKTLILTKMQTYLTQESEQADPLTIPAEGAIVVGVADLSRYNQNTVCAIVPGDTTETEGHVAEAQEEHAITVSFIHRGLPYDKLVSRMFRYAEAFKSMIRENPSLGCDADDCTIGRTEYFPDAGSIERQITAGEVELTVRTERNVSFDDAFSL